MSFQNTPIFHHGIAIQLPVVFGYPYLHHNGQPNTYNHEKEGKEYLQQEEQRKKFLVERTWRL